MPEATPVRLLGEVDPRGFRVLSDAGLTYADGSEERLARIVGAASDLSSHSQELAAAADDWGTTYSLVPSRANVLRGLDLRPGMTVLEVGCGCGPITRYLGERCGTVDSLEPMVPRAAVASLRTRDLEPVQVFVGTLDDVPRQPVYDLVVVVGVLEYVGKGAADHTPYLDFLRSCLAVLKDGGTLVLAIENALGVKYVAGAAEDHTNRPFDSLEGYALWSPARTFSRRELETLLGEAGFGATRVLGAFPDYKLSRAMLSDELFDASPQLAVGLPRFPSADHVVPRLNLADEGLTWRTLVRAGIAEHFPNSFVALATKGSADTVLWPAGRLGMLFSTDRRAEFAVRGEVRRGDAGAQFRRDRLYPDVPVRDDGTVLHTVVADERAVAGDSLVDVMLREPVRRPELLRAWLAMLPENVDLMPVDLVPHNLLVRSDGSLVAIDQEWGVRGYRRDSVVLRGLFLAAQSMAMLTRPEETMRPWVTVGDAMRGMADEAGVEIEGRWEDFVADEAAFQAAVTAADDDQAKARERAAEDLAEMWDQTLVAVRGGERFDAQWARAVESLAGQAESFERLEGEITTLAGEVTATRASLEGQRVRAEALDARRAELESALLAAERDRDRLLRGTLLGLLIRIRRRWQAYRAARTAATPPD